MSSLLYQRLATLLGACENCRKSGNQEWLDKHTGHLDQLVRDHLPGGSGFDSGTRLDDQSTSERLVFNTSFHHMHESGMYDGWTDHTVVVRPSLPFGFTLRVTGRDRNNIKDYIGEMFDQALRTTITD